MYLMNYDENEKKFFDDNPIFNKKFFNDLLFAEQTIGNFEKNNLNINNYENFIYKKSENQLIYNFKYLKNKN